MGVCGAPHPKRSKELVFKVKHTQESENMIGLRKSKELAFKGETHPKKENSWCLR